MISLKMVSMILVVIVTIVAGLYPFIKTIKTNKSHDFPIGESLASGVFLGAGLIHMLGDASGDFSDLGYDYPFAFLIAGAVFLFFLFLEHVGREIYHKEKSSRSFAILAVIMLSIHSFFTGAALGISDSTSIVLIVLLAILAHKWAASFSLSVQINKSSLSLLSKVALFIIFTLMVPLGIIFGSSISHTLDAHPMIEPIFSSIAAGTFLYLGTLHGLERANMIKQCCDLKNYYYVILGFIIMAVVAIWT